MNERAWERENFERAANGLFIHFGLYAIPGGIWEGKRAPHGSEWMMRNLEIPLMDYSRLAVIFNPKQLDARFYLK